MGAKRRANAYKAPNLSRRLKRRNKAKRKLNLMKNPTSEIWDKSKTLRRNYKQIDIALDLNQQPKILENVKSSDEILPSTVDINYFKKKTLMVKTVPKNEFQKQIFHRANLEARRKTKRKPQINREEGMCVKKLLKKYGDDYSNWRRDIKLNVFQWNDNQCQKKHKEYLKRFGEKGNIDWNKI